MATLYEIDQAMLDCIDWETGEIIDAERLDELQMQREEKIEKVALWVKNLESDAAAYKAEKDSFAEKERVAKNKIEGLKKYLTHATDGVKFQTTKVTVSFRRSEQVEIQDEDAFINYAMSTDRDDLLSYKAPTINRTAIKQALKDGQELLGATIIERQNIQIK